MPDTEIAVAAERTELLRRQIDRMEINEEDYRLHVTVSVGVAKAGEDMQEPGALMKAADTALYEAKSRGRDRVVISARVPASNHGSNGGTLL